MKKSYNWLKTLQEGKGKEISRLLFITFTTEEYMTKFLYPNTWNKRQKPYKHIHYVDRNINRLCKLWQKEGFLEKSRPLQMNIKNRWGQKQIKTVYWIIMSFEPIFKFCKEKGVNFTEEEKRLPFFIFDMKNEDMRKAILREYPQEDIINATLKFYVKNCINRYYFYLKDLYESPKKYKRFEEKAKELNDPSTPDDISIKKEIDKSMKDISKKLNLPYEKYEFNIIKLVAMELNSNANKSLLDFLDKHNKEKLSITQQVLHPEKIIKDLNDKDRITYYILHHKQLIQNLFYMYIMQLEENKDIVKSIDTKILKALELYPILPELNYKKAFKKKQVNPEISKGIINMKKVATEKFLRELTKDRNIKL